MGDQLRRIIELEGFRINSDKVWLYDNKHRQVVTGLVVNAKLNVSRRFVRQVRAMIHAWAAYGYAAAELEHVVEQMVVTTPGPVIEPDNLPPQIIATREEPFSLDFDIRRPLQSITDELTERIERAYLQRVLERHRGRIDRCAEHCGLSRRSISEKLRRYRIDKAEFEPHLAARRESVAAGEPV